MYNVAQSEQLFSPFSPLPQSEFEVVTIDLSTPNPEIAMAFSSEDNLLQQIRPGIDGPVIEDQGCSMIPQGRSQIG